jgi:hypothetical protein
MVLPDAARIAALNDHARQTFTDCRVCITNGIQALGDEMLRAILLAVQQYDSFTPDNDPYEEHDFGKIDIGEHVIFWKIDYYDVDLSMHSLDPSDPSITARVLTVMLADEY